MDASAEIRKKLAALIGHLVTRCIREARMIPAVLHREEVISIIVDDPERFARLVREEHADQAELSRENLTVKLDAVSELAKLDRLEIFDRSFWDGPEIDLTPILDLTHQLTRTFAVYLGNAATLFDREFEAFMVKFRRSLSEAGMTLRAVDFTPEDMAIFEETAIGYIAAGEGLQAFTYEKLLSSQIMMRQVVNLPEGYLLRERMFWRCLGDAALAPALIRFVIRISYISQGTWEDMIPALLGIIRESGNDAALRLVVDAAEKDVVFTCNLLCRSYDEIRRLDAGRRRQEIAAALEGYPGRVGGSGGFH
ncbi:MAG: hypothetical protein QM330_12165 [Acidobacteriota bacterium]|jgi:hypothetical protein|nr:hypothetical protein [Acidobacteriota bacterium]NLT33177.1 hypothetical protein [Acidobacteriota bacterium]